jgi:TfoX/Sxy family transcriptional regulator of competence genes
MPTPAPPGDGRELLERIAPDAPDVERRTMFGCPCRFVSGNMFMVLHEGRIVLRLAPEDREALLEMRGSAPFGPAGRTMREYVAVPPAMLTDLPELGRWVARSEEYARSLGVRTPRARRSRATRS